MANINMTFGPSNTWIVYINAASGTHEPPHYRSSPTLPASLLSRLYGRKADVRLIKSVSLGPEGSFVMCFDSASTDQCEPLWHLTACHTRLQSALEYMHNNHTFFVSIGTGGNNSRLNSTDGDYFLSSRESVRCVCRDAAVEDEAQEEAGDGVKCVAFGKDGVSVLLTKEGRLAQFGSFESSYPTMWKDAYNQQERGEGHSKAISVSMNPHSPEEEYFLAFSDGTVYFKTALLGHHRYPTAIQTTDTYFDSHVSMGDRRTHNEEYDADPIEAITAQYAVWELIQEWSLHLRKGEKPGERLRGAKRPNAEHHDFQTPAVLDAPASAGQGRRPPSGPNWICGC